MAKSQLNEFNADTETNPYGLYRIIATNRLNEYIQMLMKFYELTESEMIEIIEKNLKTMKSFFG